ncbi:hypothetical protein [Limobrevibacterium gyesilva]|uniref:Uncharacterized protein n=1 Tax=Limobrevibacterium gyesilva TaxID=2991712 RepID=A0AA41YQE4_9PROT|nr:hypothetical protein [Limobrevibacterium gyesilva]MCW3474565.1 hypothetical protein [Limobrevibacterium gyesilva]
MSTQQSDIPAGAGDAFGTAQPDVLPNGPGAAAILAAGIGSLALGIFAFAGDASPAILRAFNFWSATGPLSGVTSTAVFVWLVAWYWLARSWAGRSVSLVLVNVAAFAMLIAGLLLTFPPFMDLLQGK